MTRCMHGPELILLDVLRILRAVADYTYLIKIMGGPDMMSFHHNSTIPHYHTCVAHGSPSSACSAHAGRSSQSAVTVHSLVLPLNVARARAYYSGWHTAEAPSMVVVRS